MDLPRLLLMGLAFADAAALHAQGLKAFQANDLATACPLFERAAQADPQNADAWADCGLCYETRGDLPKAIAANRRALAGEEKAGRLRAYLNLSNEGVRAELPAVAAIGPLRAGRPTAAFGCNKVRDRACRDTELVCTFWNWSGADLELGWVLAPSEAEAREGLARAERLDGKAILSGTSAVVFSLRESSPCLDGQGHPKCPRAPTRCITGDDQCEEGYDRSCGPATHQCQEAWLQKLDKRLQVGGFSQLPVVIDSCRNRVGLVGVDKEGVAFSAEIPLYGVGNIDLAAP